MQEVPESGGLLHLGLVFKLAGRSTLFGGGQDAGGMQFAEFGDPRGIDSDGEGNPLGCGGVRSSVHGAIEEEGVFDSEILH